MKNYEKYADEIREYEGDSICADFVEPYILKSINAKCTNTSCVKCHLYRTIWLLEDYEEPEEPETDWSKVNVDTPILVRQGKTGNWLERHFAKYENGEVYAWVDGQTSWTGADKIKWRYAKLAEDEKEPEVDWSKVEVDTACEDYYDVDNEYYESANYYSDKTVAENNARADKLMRQLRRFSVEHRGHGVDFNNTNTEKHYIYYDCIHDELKTVFTFYAKTFGTILFDSEETAQAAIDEFHDELIWYFTEYRDSL